MKRVLASLCCLLCSAGLGAEEEAATCDRSSKEPTKTTGAAGQFCSAFQGLCESPTANGAWLRAGWSCSWSCTHWWGDPGRKGTSCHWKCKTPPPEAAPGTYGSGPMLAFLNIRKCDSLAGRQVIQGFAMEFFTGPATLNFFWNGAPIQPLHLQMRLPSEEACSWPLGSSHGHCFRESGFLAEIDTTRLPNGSGTLALVATDFDGWTSRLEVGVVIANPVHNNHR